MTINAKRQHVNEKANVRMKMYLNVKVRGRLAREKEHGKKE